MVYMGSKNRYAKEILKIILSNRTENQWYVEPFAGGFNVIDKVTGNRIGNDINIYLVELIRAIRDGWNPPPTVSEFTYKIIKNNKKDFPPYLVGYVGFCSSYSGRFFEGYARGKKANGEPRNYTDENRRNLLKQAKNLKGIMITNLDYKELVPPPKSIIYCDPPYANTKKYNNNFDHFEFWNWVRFQDMEGHQVYISEYEAPKDFVCVWSREVNSDLNNKSTNTRKRVEKLFTTERTQKKNLLSLF